jgi:hypothetical protein
MCGDIETRIAATAVGAYFGGPVGGMAAGILANATISNPKAAVVPALAPTPVAPTMDSTSVAAAQKLSLQKMLAQGGRSSTILSQPQSQTLGG